MCLIETIPIVTVRFRPGLFATVRSVTTSRCPHGPLLEQAAWEGWGCCRERLHIYKACNVYPPEPLLMVSYSHIHLEVNTTTACWAAPSWDRRNVPSCTLPPPPPPPRGENVWGSYSEDIYLSLVSTLLPGVAQSERPAQRPTHLSLAWDYHVDITSNESLSRTSNNHISWRERPIPALNAYRSTPVNISSKTQIFAVNLN